MVQRRAQPRASDEVARRLRSIGRLRRPRRPASIHNSPSICLVCTSFDQRRRDPRPSPAPARPPLSWHSYRHHLRRMISLASGASETQSTTCFPAPESAARKIAITNDQAENSTGTRIVDHRERRARESAPGIRALATSSKLRIGLASHGLDENLFERRLHQFEPVNLRHCRSLVQQLLRVSMRVQPDLGVPAKFFASAISRALQETTRRPQTPP